MLRVDCGQQSSIPATVGAMGQGGHRCSRADMLRCCTPPGPLERDPCASAAARGSKRTAQGHACPSCHPCAALYAAVVACQPCVPGLCAAVVACLVYQAGAHPTLRPQARARLKATAQAYRRRHGRDTDRLNAAGRDTVRALPARPFRASSMRLGGTSLVARAGSQRAIAGCSCRWWWTTPARPRLCWRRAA